MPGLFYKIENDVFSCDLIKPLKEGDVLGGMVSTDQFWSADTASMMVDGRAVNYPTLATVEEGGIGIALLPAILKLKADVSSGQVVYSKDGLSIEAKRAMKAGEPIAVFYLNGPSILSVGALKGKAGQEEQPWLIVLSKDTKPETRSAKLQAWREELKHSH